MTTNNLPKVTQQVEYAVSFVIHESPIWWHLLNNLSNLLLLVEVGGNSWLHMYLCWEYKPMQFSARNTKKRYNTQNERVSQA